MFKIVRLLPNVKAFDGIERNEYVEWELEDKKRDEENNEQESEEDDELSEEGDEDSIDEEDYDSVEENNNSGDESAEQESLIKNESKALK